MSRIAKSRIVKSRIAKAGWEYYQFTGATDSSPVPSGLALAGDLIIVTFWRRRMTRAIFLIGLLIGALSLPGAGSRIDTAAAAEPIYRPAMARPQGLPFPLSERAQSVWASGVCWSECGSYCAWGGSADCLAREDLARDDLAGDSVPRKAQGQCLKLTDTCDRYCQRQCRTSGGPLLPLDF